MFKILIVAILTLGVSLAMAEKIQEGMTYEVKVNGKNFFYNVLSVDGNSFVLENGEVKRGSGNILVTFVDEPNISLFESKYGLKLVKKGVVWSVFRNESGLNLMELSQKIVKGEGENVKTATPDWIMDVKPR